MEQVSCLYFCKWLRNEQDQKFKSLVNGFWCEVRDEVIIRTGFILNLLQVVLFMDETATPVAEEARVRHYPIGTWVRAPVVPFGISFHIFLADSVHQAIRVLEHSLVLYPCRSFDDNKHMIYIKNIYAL